MVLVSEVVAVVGSPLDVSALLEASVLPEASAVVVGGSVDGPSDDAIVTSPAVLVLLSDADDVVAGSDPHAGSTASHNLHDDPTRTRDR